MINTLIAFSIDNKLIIGLCTVALIVTGIWCMFAVPLDVEPDITNNQVQVITQAPNLGTEDIEQFVTYPVELAMANLPGVTEIRSVSRFGLSVVTIVFNDDLGTYLPRQLVGEKLVAVKEDIPQGFGEPEMGPISTGLGEIYQYTLAVDSAHQDAYTSTDLRTIQDWIIRRQMAMVPGVVEVNAFGGNILQYEVAVDPDELRAIGLTITDLFSALEKNNQNTGGGYIEKNHQANFIRGEGLAHTLEDLENVVIKNEKGIPIRVKDVATVQFGHAMRYGAFTKNGQGEAIGGMILMLKGANSNTVITAVKERISAIQKSLPAGVHIEPFLDRSELVAKTTDTISHNLLEGGLIVIFTLVLLLGNWRGGLIVASTIPLSLLFAFILMRVFGVWANLMSLGAIDFGIIVDGAVIIVECTVFLLHEKVLKGTPINQTATDAVAKDASRQMMNAAFFGQLIILIVFLPILALEGVEGKMFKPMALTFSFAMLGAMVLCLTYVPMISALFIKVSKRSKPGWGDRIVHWVAEKYAPLLSAAMQKSKWVIGISVTLLAAAVFIFTQLGGEFIPQLDEGDIAFHVILKPGSSLSESIKTSTRIEQTLLENFPEVESAMTRFGVADVPTDPMPMDIGDCFVMLKPQGTWVSADTKEALENRMKEKLAQIPGVNYEFTQPIEMRFNELLTGVREDIAIKLFGEDLQILADKAREIGQIINNVDGVADMRIEATTGLPQITVRYQRDKVAQYGLSIASLNEVIRTAFAGGKAGVIFEGEKRFDLMVRLTNHSRRNIDDVKNLFVSLPSGTQIPLREVATISYQAGPMQISRDNTHRRIYVGINVRGRDIQSLMDEIRGKLATQLSLPPGYYLAYGGAFENLERATQRLQVVVPVALGLIFILIFFALRSFSQTCMIYMAIPLAAIGGVFSLWIRGMSFSISAGVGFIVLFGVAVLNGLVLISGLNELKGSVPQLDDRIHMGTRRRIRPILLTALTDVLGFLPMAISSSAGAEVQRPLATVVIGGLLTSSLLTLFILPILYRWLEKRNAMKKTSHVTMTLLLLLGMSSISTVNKAQAQAPPPLAISIDEAVAQAQSRYPQLKAAQLDIAQQQALKQTAWDLGNTQLYTAAEELKNGNGVRTLIGIQQQQIDIFGIAPKKNLQQQRTAMATASYQLSSLALTQSVKQAYAKLYVSHQKHELYRSLDSIFNDFVHAARLRYETKATSKLEWLAAQSRAQQIVIKREQAWRDYRAAMQQFNQWMASDTVFTIRVTPPEQLTDTLAVIADSISQHPLLSIASQRHAVSQAAVKAANADFLPKLNAQYGLQEIAGESGYKTFQLGISLPLAFMQSRGQWQAAMIRREQAQYQLAQTQLEIQAAYKSMQEQYLKWLTSWNYYHTQAVPLAQEQQQGAIIAYREGAIDYITFLQNIENAIHTEAAAWDALYQLLQTQYQLEFFLRTSN